MPPIIDNCIKADGITPDEAYKTFNMGVGMSIIVAPEDVDSVKAALASEGFDAFLMGECVPGTGKVTYR